MTGNIYHRTTTKKPPVSGKIFFFLAPISLSCWFSYASDFTQFPVETLIQINTPEDVQAKRLQAIRYIFHENSLPKSLPKEIQQNFLDERWNQLNALASIERITIRLPREFESISYLFVPKRVLSNNLLIGSVEVKG